jgi:hypothetical protein
MKRRIKDRGWTRDKGYWVRSYRNSQLRLLVEELDPGRKVLG